MKVGLNNFKRDLIRIKTGKNKSFLPVRFNFLSHLKGKWDKFIMPDSYERNLAIVDTNLLMYSEMRQFQAYLTKNAFDMSIHNEYDTYPHVNFGTIDNPVLIFGAGTTWRMVACVGPSSDEESSGHEKMYFIVREGPIHRCIMCGQCFKLVKLKDEVASEENMYYSNVFTQIADRVIGDTEDIPWFSFPFTLSDPRDWRTNIVPRDNLYVFANADEADHIMVDPAFRLQFYKEQLDDHYRRNRVGSEIERQAELAGFEKNNKTVMQKDVFETWLKIEKEILRFDRVYNRFEKFEGRKLFDPLNHDRRERRMLERQSERLNENYTFYSGGLTEKEQMYRDYYETDLEDFPDNNAYNEKRDNFILAASREFDINKYKFAEENTYHYLREPADSFVEKMLFKYRYREYSDKDYKRRSERVSKRAFERSSSRDPHVVKNLGDKLEEIQTKKGLFQNISALEDELLPFASYVAEEGLQQFKDYNQTDIEEGTINGELLEDLCERDRIQFAECYLNEYNRSAITDKQYIMIPKRPFDNKKSIVGNFVEDLIDFNYRVKPIARNLVFRDVSSKYQPLPLNENEAKIVEQDEDRYRPVLSFKKSGKTGINHLTDAGKKI
jgi:hypothetical protein